MGTAAVFSIHGHNALIIGMTSDGFPENLEFIASECWKIAKEIRVLTKWKKEDKETIQKVMEKVVSKHSDWLFLDHPNNPSFISYSAEMSIKNKLLLHFEGYRNRRVKVTNMLV